MDIANITIIVRTKSGAVQKAIWDGAGKLQQGDAKTLELVTKMLAPPPPPKPAPTVVPPSPPKKA